MKILNSTPRAEHKIHYGQACYDEAEIAAAMNILNNHSLTLMDGPAVAEFEQKIATLFGKQHGLMVNSGSSANLLAIATSGLPAGSEIITPALNWSTTIAPMLQHNLMPAFVDVEADTFVIDAMQIEEMIGPKTRAIMVPDLIGNIAQWDILADIAERHNLITIHDSADTLGGSYDGKPSGAWSTISTTSFYASHIITCAGFGGMFCCNDPERLQQAKLLRGWGRRSSLTGEVEALEYRFSSAIDDMAYDGKFIFDAQGYNFMPSEIAAAFGLEQLKKLPRFIDTRIRNYQRLFAFFSNYQDWIIMPRQHLKSHTPWLAFPMIIKADAPFERIELQTFFEQQNIQTRPIFTGNILRHPGFMDMKCRKSQSGYPNADRVMAGGIMFGCHQGMTDTDVDYIIEQFKHFSEHRGVCKTEELCN